jgi:hypothetical protein
MVVRVLCAAALLGAVACSSIQPVMNAREFIPSNRPQRVWVVNQQNESYVLTFPRVEGDNIVGTLMNSDQPFSIPIQNAQLVEAKQRDKKKTLVAGLVLAGVAGGVVFLAANAGNSKPDPQDYDNGMAPVRLR